jgi:hypothetical protein
MKAAMDTTPNRRMLRCAIARFLPHRRHPAALGRAPIGLASPVTVIRLRASSN